MHSDNDEPRPVDLSGCANIYIAAETLVTDAREHGGACTGSYQGVVLTADVLTDADDLIDEFCDERWG